jgi:iron complex transport system substrate-binding protein
MDGSDLRIISLLPGATELIFALGLGEALVARSHECDYPLEAQALPICTEARLDSSQSSGQIDTDVAKLAQSALSIYLVKTEVIKHLEPTHILTQDQCDVCAVSLADVEKALSELVSTNPQVISLQPNVLSDLWTDIERVASIFGVDPQPLLTQLQGRIDLFRQKNKTLDHRPKVAALEWVDPLMATGNWIPELIEIAGGQSLFGKTGEHSPYLDWDKLVEADPDCIIIMPCGFDLDRTRTESKVLAKNPAWDKLRAVQEGKVFVTDGNAYFNRPSPRLVDSTEILAEILHPDLYDYGYKGKAWDQFTTSA